MSNRNLSEPLLRHVRSPVSLGATGKQANNLTNAATVEWNLQKLSLPKDCEGFWRTGVECLLAQGH